MKNHVCPVMDNVADKKAPYVAPQLRLIEVDVEENVMCDSDKDLIDDEAS